jgi:hypothetical protein
VAQQQIDHFQASTSNSEVEWSIPVLILSIQGYMFLRQKELDSVYRSMGYRLMERQLIVSTRLIAGGWPVERERGPSFLCAYKDPLHGRLADAPCPCAG